MLHPTIDWLCVHFAGAVTLHCEVSILVVYVVQMLCNLPLFLHYYYAKAFFYHFEENMSTMSDAYIVNRTFYIENGS